jgi:hypothetical protein
MHAVLMDSACRHLERILGWFIQELEGVAAEKKALEEKLAQAIAEHDTEASELRSEKTALQVSR